MRCKIPLDDEEGILSSAMKLEEEANSKEDDEEETSEREMERNGTMLEKKQHKL